MKAPLRAAAAGLLALGGTAAAVYRAPAPPAIAEVQAAYAASAALPGGQAPPQVHSAECRRIAGERYTCQVSYLRGDPRGRLHFEVVTVDRRAGRWWLLSGAAWCRRERNAG